MKGKCGVLRFSKSRFFIAIVCPMYAISFIFRYSLYNIVVQNAEQANLVNALENQIPIDIWSYATPSRPGQILVPKEDRQQFLDALDNAGVAYSIHTENIRE